MAVGDGASAEIHLIELAATPTDVGKVPNSTSADYAAVWTDDDRLWFPSDEPPEAPHGRLYWFAATDKAAGSMPVRGAVLIRSVRVLP